MKLESDGNYIIFTPETDNDMFGLGKIAGKNPVFEYAFGGHEKSLLSFKLEKNKLLELLNK